MLESELLEGNYNTVVITNDVEQTSKMGRFHRFVKSSTSYNRN